MPGGGTDEVDDRIDNVKHEYWAAWSGFIAALAESGVMSSTAGLLPSSTATTVRVLEGSRTVQNGPFADSKEHLGGHFVIDIATSTRRWIGGRNDRPPRTHRSRYARCCHRWS